MRIPRLLLIAIGALILPCTIPAPASAQVYISLSAPPLMPQYQQPPVSNPNYQWIPGYWGQSQSGYYWVPGTWMAAPQQGLLWTPGYWGYQPQQSNYAWNQGYGGSNVRYYGGVNYGSGYYGTGYVGGQWYGNQFRYNTAVTRVNPQYVRNVYVNRTVVVHNVNRYAYNGPGGIRMHPNAQQVAWARERHVGLTPMQRTHMTEAQQDRNMYANVNHGKPAEVTVLHPFSATNRPANFKPVATTDRTPATNTMAKPAAKPVTKSASEPANKPAPNTAHQPPAPSHQAMNPGAKPNGRTGAQSQPQSKPRPQSKPQSQSKPPSQSKSQSKPASHKGPPGE